MNARNLIGICYLVRLGLTLLILAVLEVTANLSRCRSIDHDLEWTRIAGSVVESLGRLDRADGDVLAKQLLAIAVGHCVPDSQERLARVSLGAWSEGPGPLLAIVAQDSDIAVQLAALAAIAIVPIVRLIGAELECTWTLESLASLAAVCCAWLEMNCLSCSISSE